MHLRKFAAPLACVVSLAVSGSAHAEDKVADALAAMREYNLIVLGDLASASSEVEGRAYVGGNLSGGASNYNLDGLASGAGLVVGGKTTGGSKNVKMGDIKVGGNIESGIEFGNDPDGQVLSYGGAISGGPINVNNPDTKVFDGGLGASLAATTADMADDMYALSGFLGGLTKTDDYTFDGSNVYFNASSTGEVAVFTLADLSIFNNRSVQFASPTNYSLVVVNVLSSSSMSTPGGMNFNGPGGLGAKVIWNFANLDGGDTLNLQNAWYGSILAPKAHVLNNTAIEGSMVFGSFAQGGEVHTPGLLVDDFRTAVPEPGAWAMMILGFGAAGAMMRRRRAAFA